MRHRRWLSAALLLVAVLTTAACSDGFDSPQARGPGTVPGPPLPAACEVVPPADAQAVLGVPVTTEGPAGTADRCRYVSERRDDVEITVDRPGITGAVGVYRGLNTDAEPVTGVGDEAALRVAGGVGELVFVKGPARLFVLVSGPSSNRDVLLGLATAAARRL